MRTSFLLLCIVLSMLLSVSTVRAEDYIWIEGEDAKLKSVRGHSWYDSVKKKMLSGGEYLSNWNARKPGVASYEVQVEKAGSYAFWVRINPLGSKVSYRINQEDWTQVQSKEKVDQINIAENDQPDLRFLAWVKVGSVELREGKNTVGFKFHSGNHNHGMLDCFVFAARPFVPNGARKPGEKLGLSEPSKWAFEPDYDEFTSDAWLDLRGLNEEVAGESGYIRTTPAGGFVKGNGKPIRFWAANTGVYHRSGVEALKRHCKHIAKRGINMVRFHGSLYPKAPGSKITDVDESQIDKCQKLVAVAKQEGIYTTFSPYWAVATKYQDSWNIPGHTNRSTTALLFWDKTMQEGYKAWMRELLTRPNPYDQEKTPLGKDPALAIIQIQNEDSMLFWTMRDVQGDEKKRLDAIYAKWLKQKGKTTPPSLNFRYWELNNPNDHHRDTIQFLTETMHKWNTEFARFLRVDLGCEALVNAGNWKTANQIKLLDHERWSYTANDVLAVNRYVGGVHLNPNQPGREGSLVAKGDFFTNHSKLKHPRDLPTNLKQVPGYPMMVTESTWVPPLGYQSEGPFLVSAYSSLTGLDGYYWFALGNVGYDPTIEKWQAANPTIMGGWPAAALMFRKGYIQQGEPAVHEERALEDMWDLATPIIAEDQSFDPNRDKGEFGEKSNIKHGVDPLAFLVGPVEVVYTETPDESRVVDLSKYIHREQQTVRSITNQLELDYGTGLCTLNAPKAQGATGFLKQAGAIELDTITIEAQNEFATVLMVSMDGKKLADSQRVLLQITTQCRPYGWKSSPTTFKSKDKKNTFQGYRIEDTGASPWNVVNTKLSVQIENPNLTQATLLDLNGYPIQDAKVQAIRTNGSLKVTPPAESMYLILH